MTYSEMIPPVGFQVSLPFSSPALPVNGTALTSTPAWDFMPSALQDDRDPLSYFNPPSSIDLSPAGVLSPVLTALPQTPSSPLAPALPVSSGLVMTSSFAQPQSVLATSQAMDVGGKSVGYSQLLIISQELHKTRTTAFTCLHTWPNRVLLSQS